MREYTYETLKKITKTKLGKEYVSLVEKYYQENYADKPILALPFSAYKRYETHGDRSTFERAYFERRKRLFLLQILAVAKNSYLTPLEDVLSAICDEYTWVIPAHSYGAIDLFASETASYLAETVYIYQDKLSKLIRERIRTCVERNIIVKYESQTLGWERAINNWLAVCARGVGLSYLYLFPERFDEVKERLFNTFKRFIELGLDDEGYCSEGITYWVYGFGNFCEFFDAYVRKFGERPEFIDCEKLKNALSYLKNTRMQGDVFLPYADGGYRHITLNAHQMNAIKALYPKDFAFPESDFNLEGSKAVGLSTLYNLALTKPEADAEKEGSYYYEQAQVFIRKREKYAFTAKSGNNNEMHNHNDVGAFQIVKDGKRYICDVGAGLYTKEYYGKGRYGIFNCNSLSHSIPVIDGNMQPHGAEYCGNVLSVGEDLFSVDIAKAYGEGVAKKVAVTYQTKENGVDVRYECSGIEKEIVFHFVSDLKPKYKNSAVWISDMKISCDKEITPTLSVVKYFPHSIVRKKGAKKNAYVIDYAVQTSGDADMQFSFEF